MYKFNINYSKTGSSAKANSIIRSDFLSKSNSKTTSSNLPFTFRWQEKAKKKCDINGYKETEQVTCLVDISVLATIIKPKI